LAPFHCLANPNHEKVPTMPDSVTDQKQFEILTQSIAYDMQTLSIHWKLYNDLQNAVEEYRAELNQSRAFWTLTFDGHRDTSLFRLCRLYDQHKSALNLKNWLIALRDNPQFFSSSQSTPDTSTLAQDIELVSVDDPMVNKIVRLRNNALAHVAVIPILSVDVRLENCCVPSSDVQVLVDRARNIVNCYTSLLKRESYSTTIVGYDDYRTVLESIRKSLSK